MNGHVGNKAHLCLAHLHSATHGHAEETSNCSGDQTWIYIFHRCKEELHKWHGQDMAAWEQEITPRCPNQWLIGLLDWLQITMFIYCTCFLFSSSLDRCISKPYSLCVGEEKYSWDCISVTPPQIQCEAGREKHIDMQPEWIERGGQRKEGRDSRDRGREEWKRQKTEDIFDHVGVQIIKACIIIGDPFWSSRTYHCSSRALYVSQSVFFYTLKQQQPWAQRASQETFSKTKWKLFFFCCLKDFIN